MPIRLQLQTTTRQGLYYAYNQPNDRAYMPVIYQLNDRADTPAIYERDNDHADMPTILITVAPICLRHEP